MVETLTASLILAILSGLTFIAYKHPLGYKRIAPSLMVVTAMIAISIIAFNFGGLQNAIEHLHKVAEETPAIAISTYQDSLRRNDAAATDSLDDNNQRSSRDLFWVSLVAPYNLVYTC
jgi:hypothetical protein